MRALLVGNYRPDSQLSMLGFAEVLQRSLGEFGIDSELTTPTQRVLKHKDQQFSKWLGYVDKFILYPKTLRKKASQFDCVHILDQGNAVYVDYVAKFPHLITCHDVLAIRASKGQIPGWNVGRAGRMLQNRILSSLSRTRSIVCVSNSTKNDLIQLLPGGAGVATVILNGLYREVPRIDFTTIDECLQRHQISGDFLLHVGGNQPYKNRHGLLEIYACLVDLMGRETPALVLAGPKLPDNLTSLLTKKHIQVIRPSDPDIACLYSSARALIFPSLYEGFGLPIIEAQAAGCPVFTSNRDPMTEIGADSAAYFPPDQPALAAGIIAERWPTLETMIAAGYGNVTRFTAQRMVQSYADCYRALNI